MAVALRLQRRGRTHRPFYKIVASDSRNPRDGKFIEEIGYYDANNEPSTISINAERAQYWYGVGAEVSETVRKLLKAQKIELSRGKTHKDKK